MHLVSISASSVRLSYAAGYMSSSHQFGNKYILVCRLNNFIVYYNYYG